MSGYIGVGDNSKKVSKMYIGVSGQSKAVQKAYIGVAGKAKLQYQNKVVVGDLPIGTIVKGIYGNEEFIVIHKGNPNTSVYDSSCDGVWLMAKNCVTSLRFNSYTSRIFTDSEAMKWLNSAFYNSLTVKSSVKKIKIPYYTTGDQPPLCAGANGFSCYAFMLAAVEVGFVGYYKYLGDGVKLSWFDSTNAANTKRVATLNGQAVDWWLRTADTGDSQDKAAKTNANGSYGTDAAKNGHGIRPAFIVTYDTKVEVV